MDAVVQFTLNPIHHDQPDFFHVEPDPLRKIAHRGRLLKLNGSPPRLIGKQLTENLDIDCHSAPYSVSNIVSRSESGTSKTVLCGGNGSSRMYSGIL